MKPWPILFIDIDKCIPLPYSTFTVSYPINANQVITNSHGSFLIALTNNQLLLSGSVDIDSRIAIEELSNILLIGKLNLQHTSIDLQENIVINVIDCKNRVQLDSPLFISDDKTFFSANFKIIEEEINLPINNINNDIISTINLLADNNIKIDINPSTKMEVVLYKLMHEFAATIDFRLALLETLSNDTQWEILSEVIADKIKTQPERILKKKKRISIDSSSPAPIVSLASKELPEHVLKVFEEEYSRFCTMPSHSVEYSQILEYLRWLDRIPWNIYTGSAIDIKELDRLLNVTHYGLLDTKRRLIEDLYVEQICKTTTKSILCFVGPPGTGKSTIASCIAKASNRSFARISLGGLTDPSSLKGFSRTYSSSAPGILVKKICNLQTLDPIILLDEVDKTSSDKRGSIDDTLLEILDNNQNNEFYDTYLNLSLDLSNVKFICTANDINNISKPLLDRMEVVTFADYSKDEKKVISEKYILPRLSKERAIENFNITIDDEIFNKVSDYSLREIEQIFRRALNRAITDLALEKEDSIVINNSFITDFMPTKKLIQVKNQLGFSI